MADTGAARVIAASRDARTDSFLRMVLLRARRAQHHPGTGMVRGRGRSGRRVAPACTGFPRDAPWRVPERSPNRFLPNSRRAVASPRGDAVTIQCAASSCRLRAGGTRLRVVLVHVHACMGPGRESDFAQTILGREIVKSSGRGARGQLVGRGARGELEGSVRARRGATRRVARAIRVRPRSSPCETRHALR